MGTVFTNSEELKQYLHARPSAQPESMQKLLVEEQMVTGQELRALIETCGLSPTDRAFGELLQKSTSIKASDYAQLLARSFALPFVKLSEFDIDLDVIKLVPEEVARKYKLIPLFADKTGIVVAMSDPACKKAAETLDFVTGKIFEPVVATVEDIEKAITKYYGANDERSAIDNLSDAEHALALKQQAHLEEFQLGQEKPTVRLVRNIMIDAIKDRASDIHLRAREKNVDLLFRIDGQLIKIRSFPKELLQSIVSRIKIIGAMNIAEHRLPQDGQARIKYEERVIDLRISIIPTIHGESVVVRILDKSGSIKTLRDIGFNSKDEALFSSLVTRSHGIILVTGPTGCGKSTTLYAALEEIRKTNRNIITVEDPVEYHIEGITQIQVNSSIDYTFARALRHILRHDPDVIMVGEIRDVETAKMAVESSLTGHIVLSSLHTNSAATSVTRLLEMGVDSYLVNASLLGVLAQRLVRKNCTHCIEEENVDAHVREALKVEEGEIFYRGKGCEYCHLTGYHGRVAVYELLVVTSSLRALIVPNVNAAVIEQQAVSDGMVPLTQMALELARHKTTSLEEVYRIRLT
jgi:type IV pilus assembly protein PilB